MAPEDLAAIINEPVIMVGDGVKVYGELFSNLLGENVIFAPSQLHEPSASSLGMLAGEKFLSGEHLNAADAVPVYVRSSDAELNLVQKGNRKTGKEAR